MAKVGEVAVVTVSKGEQPKAWTYVQKDKGHLTLVPKELSKPEPTEPRETQYYHGTREGYP